MKNKSGKERESSELVRFNKRQRDMLNLYEDIAKENTSNVRYWSKEEIEKYQESFKEEKWTIV